MSYHSSSTEHAGQLIRLGLFRLLTCGTRLISPIFRALNAVAQLVDLLRSHGCHTQAGEALGFSDFVGIVTRIAVLCS
jgi:hypothetical protein